MDGIPDCSFVGDPILIEHVFLSLYARFRRGDKIHSNTRAHFMIQAQLDALSLSNRGYVTHFHVSQMLLRDFQFSFIAQGNVDDYDILLLQKKISNKINADIDNIIITVVPASVLIQVTISKVITNTITKLTTFVNNIKEVENLFNTTIESPEIAFRKKNIIFRTIFFVFDKTVYFYV
jgi:hypothetical protein